MRVWPKSVKFPDEPPTAGGQRRPSEQVGAHPAPKEQSKAGHSPARGPNEQQQAFRAWQERVQSSAAASTSTQAGREQYAPQRSSQGKQQGRADGSWQDTVLRPAERSQLPTGQAAQPQQHSNGRSPPDQGGQRPEHRGTSVPSSNGTATSKPWSQPAHAANRFRPSRATAYRGPDAPSHAPDHVRAATISAAHAPLVLWAMLMIQSPWCFDHQLCSVR